MTTEEIVDYTSLDSTIQILLKKSAAVRENAYSPYSKFKVGAAILCVDGTMYTGCNVENASYPVGTCAERAVIAKAVSEGKTKFKALTVVADKKNNVFTTPCGFCRQAIVEFGEVPIYLCGLDMKKVFRTNISSLLPHAFDMGNAGAQQ